MRDCAADDATDRRRFGRMVLAVAVDRADHDVRCDADTAVGDRGVDAGHLHRRDTDALAECDGRHRRLGPRGDRRQQAVLLTRQPRAGEAAEPVAAQVGVQLVRAEPARDLDRADVARLREHAGEGQSLGPVLLGVVESGTGEVQQRRDRERRRR